MTLAKFSGGNIKRTGAVIGATDVPQEFTFGIAAGALYTSTAWTTILVQDDFLTDRISFNASNTFLGIDAGNVAGQTGYSVTAIGREAFGAITTGYATVAVGDRALQVATAVNRAVVIGAYAAQRAIDTNLFVAVGYYALQEKVTGNSDVAIGAYAGQDKLTGNVVAIGRAAARFGTGNFNMTAIGHYAGENSTGNRGIFLGYSAGRNRVGGHDVLYIHQGSDTDPTIYGNTDKRNIGIGVPDTTSFGGGDHVLQMNNVTTAPSGNITDGGIIFIEGGDLKYLPPSGVVNIIGSGEHRIYLGETANLSANTGYIRGLRQTASGVGLSFEVYDATATKTQAIAILGDGKVGINTTSPTSDLTVNGALLQTAPGTSHLYHILNSAVGKHAGFWFKEDGTDKWLVRSLSTDEIAFYSYSSTRNEFVVNYTGGIGIGPGNDRAGSVGAVTIDNVLTAPTGTPTGGGVLYVEAGALKYKGTSGTVTTLGVA